MSLDENKIEIFLPSNEHILELKQKGIDIEIELSRIVFDNLLLIKQGKIPRKLGISISKEQMDTLSKYGIDCAGYGAMEFKKELHNILVKK